MPKASKGGFYAVQKGRSPGIYMTWDECEAQVKGFPGAKYQKFKSVEEAEAFAGVALPSATAQPAPHTLSADGAHYKTPYTRPVGNPVDTVLATELTSQSQATAVKAVPEKEGGWDVVYSDGACSGNGTRGAVAGVGVWWGRYDPRNISERCPGDQTNNRAELIAIVRVLETTPSDPKRPLLIKTDSQYSIKCLEIWIHNWKRNNWRSSVGQAVKNKEIIQYLGALLDLRARQRQKVKLQHVKGHAGEEGNEGADRLAVRGCGLREESERDWTALTREVEKRIAKVNVRDEEVAEVEVESFEVEGDIYYADMILDADELEKDLSD